MRYLVVGTVALTVTAGRSTECSCPANNGKKRCPRRDVAPPGDGRATVFGDGCGTVGRRPRDRHDEGGGRSVLRDDPGRHGRGRDQSGEARRRRRQPPLRAAVRGRAPRRRRRPAEPVLRLAEPEQAQRVRGLPTARRQGRRPASGPAVARARRELRARHSGQVSRLAFRCRHCCPVGR